MIIGLLRSCIVCLAIAGAGTAGAATLEGQRFDDAVRLADQPLRLNGVGVRAVMFVKGYVAGLYLDEPRAVEIGHDIQLFAGTIKLASRGKHLPKRAARGEV